MRINDPRVIEALWLGHNIFREAHAYNRIHAEGFAGVFKEMDGSIFELTVKDLEVTDWQIGALYDVSAPRLEF